MENHIKPKIAELDYKEKNLKVHTANTCYWYDADKDTVMEQVGSTPTELGCGKIVVKAAAKKNGKTKKTRSIVIAAELTRDQPKDYEIIPYSPDEAQNLENIAAFMARYITKPFEYLDNVIGVEINFNKVFYTPERLRPLDMITKDLADLEKELADLENELAL